MSYPRITVFAASEEPIYRQISNQISAQILSGEMPSEAPLPPIRTVAAELRISVITVKKAWEELERAGLIYSVVGRGTFVAPRERGDLDDQRLEVARERLVKEAKYCLSLGLTLDELIDMLRKDCVLRPAP